MRFGLPGGGLYPYHDFPLKVRVSPMVGESDKAINALELLLRMKQILRSCFAKRTSIVRMFGLLALLSSPSLAYGQHTAAGSKAPWEFSAQAYWYLLPQDSGDDFLLPILYADRGAWHFEGRHNYEELHTATFFVGRKFGFGDKVSIELVPMLGGFVGDIDGIAPGLEMDFAWNRFELYTEGEYVWDLDDTGNNFFYLWSELSWQARDWIRLGLVGQRTRAYQTDLDIQRGLVTEATLRERFRLGVWWFNPGTSDSFVSLGFGIDF